MGYPVVKENRLDSMLSRRDYRRLRKERQLNAPVEAFMNINLGQFDWAKVCGRDRFRGKAY